MNDNEAKDLIDTDELLRLLEDEKFPLKDALTPNKGKGINKENRDVLRFIRKLGLAPGENRVPTFVIYYCFIKWAHNTVWTTRWGKEEFFRTFKQHFEQKRSGRQRYYMINDALNLSEELYNKAMKYDKIYQKRKPTK